MPNGVHQLLHKIAHDGCLNVAEGELIRIVFATRDCPLPPILFDNG